MTNDETRGPIPLPADCLRRQSDPVSFGVATTAEIAALPGLAGQDRAYRAVSLAASIDRRGYNLFVIGPPGSGKHGGVRDFLSRMSAEAQTPPDWVYVNNFQTTHRPIAIRLPAGRATALRNAMEDLIEDLRVALPSVFEGEDYSNRQGAIDATFRQRQEDAFEELNREATAEQIAVMRTPQGFAMAPAPGGEVIKPEAFNALPEAERGSYETRIRALQEKLAAILKTMPRWEKERRDQLRALNREVAGIVVRHAIAEVRRAFEDVPALGDHLAAVEADIVENAALFLSQEEEASPFGNSGTADGRFDRYRVNALVEHEAGARGAPVEAEDRPTLGNLVGRVEHLQQQGTLFTNFLHIKPGALHRANGGYLLLDARSILLEPLSWQALKRALRNGEIKIESAGEYVGLVHTISLEPDPIPLDIKVALFGDRDLYYLLSAADPDVADLFKIMADYEDTAEWTPDAEALYAGLIATIIGHEKLRHADAGAIAQLVEHAAREADDARRLSMMIAPLADVLREADHFAALARRDVITDADIASAIAERQFRADRIRERSQEMILREIALIDTAGEAVGQINGLSVMSLGEGTFGRPTRITVRVRVGNGTVVDIEREVDLGGPLHSKGVLILSGYLQSNYAHDMPMSLAATVVFEQSYGGVDGDSASSAELYALLSALAEVPIRQSIAVTGSVNQLGHVQAIGGANHKIEGFFDICSRRGLTGSQGVIVPRSNVQHLMLRQDVVEACAAGRFHVWAASTIDEGIEILTGRAAGQRGADGRYPDGSINRLVEDRLIAFAKARRAFQPGPPAPAGPSAAIA